MKRFLGVFLGLLILIAGIIALGTYWTFYQPLPNYNATLKQPALQQAVDIH